MKVRVGFVSNSSTSSFCCQGIAFDSPQQLWGEDWDGDEYEDIDKAASKLGLSAYCLQEYDCGWVVGLDFTSMKSDETRKEFEKRAADLIAKFAGKKQKCEVQEGTYPS